MFSLFFFLEEKKKTKQNPTKKCRRERRDNIYFHINLSERSTE